MKILFLVPYPPAEIPSQRFRFEQYISILEQRGFKIIQKGYLHQSALKSIRNKTHVFINSITIISALIRRLVYLPFILRFDFIFIHREAMPLGPPLLEWCIAKVLRKKIIYDFDDAIWLTDNVNESNLERILRWRGKVKHICKWSYKVSAGNKYLAEYASQFNHTVIINPTTIDTENIHNPQNYSIARQHNEKKITIGWTGSYSTIKYLEELFPVLKIIEEKYPFVSFLVIADRPSNMNLKNQIFKRWSRETEVIDLMLADIGIMPLPDDEWTRGKCGFKALQYMALAIPAVASPIGVNKAIIEDGITGYLCSTESQWFTCLEKLITNEKERLITGRAGRQKVIANYSVLSNTDNFLSLFQ